MNSSQYFVYNNTVDQFEQPNNEKETTLSNEELAAIDAAEPYDAGLGVTLDEAHELARERTKAWMNTNPKPRAA